MTHAFPVICTKSLLVRDRLEHWLRMNRLVSGYMVDRFDGTQVFEPWESGVGRLSTVKALGCAKASCSFDTHGVVTLKLGPITASIGDTPAFRDISVASGLHFEEEWREAVVDFCLREAASHSNETILGFLERLRIVLPDSVHVPLFIQVDNGVD